MTAQLTSDPARGPIGVLLVNLGTPEAPTTGAVRRYLREFLGDGRVLDINPVGRQLLLNAIILPFRSPKSAAAYKTIWDAERGSPLLFHSQDLTAGVARTLGDGYRVVLAMRYGRPSIADGLAELQAAGVERVVVVPLYPQYASSSTGSSLEKVYAESATLPVPPQLRVVPDFYDDPGFIEAVAAVARPHLDAFGADHLLISFHGVPERHVTATDFGTHCLQSPDCCARIVPANRSCYSAQSYATARALRLALDWPEAKTSVAFQSRLGRIPWIKPYTDERLDALAKDGVKRLAVICPSFVADCLETLEEIGDRAKAQFTEAGGEDLLAIPCVNAAPEWVAALSAIVREAATG